MEEKLSNIQKPILSDMGIIYCSEVCWLNILSVYLTFWCSPGLFHWNLSLHTVHKRSCLQRTGNNVPSTVDLFHGGVRTLRWKLKGGVLPT
ncbi:hypothetical protein J6590_084922 [Homalodisca vitripennis]|nr:hypothetical protein J6590_084922 [Homalodisca vitripennis]